MITFSQAVDWLNAETVTKLSQNHVDAISKMRNAPPNVSNSIFKDLSELVSRHDSPDEEPELNIYLGVHLYEKGSFQQALDYLEQAVLLLTDNDDHRLALVECMRFYTANSLGDASDPADFLRNAIRHFNNRACFYYLVKDKAVRDYLGDREQWYRKKMIEIAYEVVKDVASVYGCLFVFDASRLSYAASQARERVIMNIRQSKSEDAIREIDFLKEITRKSRDYRETGEVFVIAGLLRAMKGEPTQAMNEFHAALAQYQPQGHEQIFIRWMLSLQQMTQPALCADAFKNMETSIYDTSNIVIEEDHKNDLYKKIWYEVFMQAMDLCLQNSIQNQGTAGGFVPPSPDNKRRKKNFSGFPGMG